MVSGFITNVFLGSALLFGLIFYRSAVPIFAITVALEVEKKFKTF
jgi:hypothetical protein